MEGIAEEIQRGYVDDDLLDVPIGDWVEKRRDPKTKEIEPFEMTALYPALNSALGLGALGLTAGPTVPSKVDQLRIANCLKRLGLRKVFRWVNGRSRRVWVERA
jgi:hypothetical protein